MAGRRLIDPEDPLGPWRWAGLVLCVALAMVGVWVMLGALPPA